MTKLSVNVNKIATLRNARGENNPDLLKMAQVILTAGADGITVHPRPDERHIKKADVFMLKKNLSCELNVEGYPSPHFINLMKEIMPAQITLVPDQPGALTSSAGFKFDEDFFLVADAISQLRCTKARISLFVDPLDFLGKKVSPLKDAGADRIELYTKAFADNLHCKKTLDSYIDLASRAHDLGLEINAGHDLSLDNLAILLKAIPFIEEVSIGHALICDALTLGIEETVRRYAAIAHAWEG